MSSQAGSSTFSSHSGSSSADLLPLNFSALSLVGREKETKALEAIHEQTRQPNAPSQVVLVHGDSGSGKTTLVRNLEPVVEKHGGFFISGKHGQFGNAARPYSAFVEAVTELCYLIQSNAKRAEIEQSIRQGLTDDEIQVLTNLMPSIGLIVSTAALDEVRPDEENPLANEQKFQHFKLLVRSFLACVCSSASHIALFLEDLHWADESSRLLFTSLASDAGSTNILLIGSYRDEQPFCLQQDDLPGKLAVSDLSVGPLSQQDVNILVSKVTEMRLDETEELSAIVHQKTGGNPYFVVQYLEMLHRRGLVLFSFGGSKWVWDVQAISATTDVSENVASLLLDKIGCMPIDVQVILMIGAMLGFSFDADIVFRLLSSPDLAAILQTNPSFQDAKMFSKHQSGGNTSEREIISSTQFDKALGKAAQSGLIEASTARKYKFSHDRVQQSAYAMSPSGTEGDKLRFQLGKEIITLSRSDRAEEWMLFASVDLLAKTSLADSLEMARLCLEAATKASAKSAFTSAAHFADQGVQCLPPNIRWKDHYDLCLELHQCSALMHYSHGNFDRSNKAVSAITSNAHSLEDKLLAYHVGVLTLGARNDLPGAIAQCIVVLDRLGVKLPRKTTNRQATQASKSCRRLFKGRMPTDLLGFPRLTDPRISHAMRLLRALTIYDWRVGEANSLFVHVYTMCQLTLEYGMHSAGSYAISLYSCLLGQMGYFKEAYEYGMVALKLASRPGMKEFYPDTVKVVHLIIYHMRNPIHASVEPMLQAYHVSKEIGKVEIAAYCLQAHAMFSVVVCMPLENLEKQIQGYCNFCREFHQKAVLMELLPFYQLTLNLLGKCEDPLVLSGAGMVEDEFVGQLRFSNEGASSLLLLSYARIWLLYLLDELELADAERRKIDPKKDFFSTYFMKFLNHFFCGLVCLNLARKTKLRKHKRQARLYRDQLKTLAEAGSPNFVPMLKLIETEILALKDNTGALLKDFNTAITMAGRCGFRLVKAIACERAGVYLCDCGDEATARDYLLQAGNEFLEYGARAKLEQMNRKYGLDIQIEGEHWNGQSKASLACKPHIVEDWKQQV